MRNGPFRFSCIGYGFPTPTFKHSRVCGCTRCSGRWPWALYMFQCSSFVSYSNRHDDVGALVSTQLANGRRTAKIDDAAWAVGMHAPADSFSIRRWGSCNYNSWYLAFVGYNHKRMSVCRWGSEDHSYKIGFFKLFKLIFVCDWASRMHEKVSKNHDFCMRLGRSHAKIRFLHAVP